MLGLDDIDPHGQLSDLDVWSAGSGWLTAAS
jgi:hypothetical protein